MDVFAELPGDIKVIVAEYVAEKSRFDSYDKIFYFLVGCLFAQSVVMFVVV